MYLGLQSQYSVWCTSTVFPLLHTTSSSAVHVQEVNMIEDTNTRGFSFILLTVN